MIAKRVIPCLDVHAGQVTRGVQFGKAEAGELRNVGDPVALALRYNEQGADEMVFFDITASAHGRATMVDVIERAADQCFMPLTVGGGLRSVDDMFTMLRAGADKISINSSALATPDLIRAGAEKFGSQCIVVSIDAKRVAADRWEVFSHGGRKATGLEAVEWAKRAVDLGAGEIVLNSIDADGTKAGFDLVITRRISESVANWSTVYEQADPPFGGTILHRQIEESPSDFECAGRAGDRHGGAAVSLSDLVHIDVAPATGGLVYDFKGGGLAGQLAYIPEARRQRFTAARLGVRPGRRAHRVPIDNQVEACLPSPSSATDEKGEVAALNRELG